MTVTIASFRQDFPEFDDSSLYPDSGITYYLNLAGLLLNVQRWSTILDFGTAMFVAHNLVLERKAQAEAENGAPPGVSTGPVSSKSVDKVSISYDTTAGLDEGAGHWNETIYGKRFIHLARMIGTGPLQIGIGCSNNPLSSANAWAGPYPYPGWFG